MLFQFYGAAVVQEVEQVNLCFDPYKATCQGVLGQDEDTKMLPVAV